jgi:membrane associated rhomboid family serine protease
VFDRRLSSAIITLLVALLYGAAMLRSLVPAESISWSGHFFGFLAGIVAARLRYPRDTLSSDASRPACATAERRSISSPAV